MSNSSLVTYTRLTDKKTSPRKYAIDTITIHCIVGQWTAKQGCDYFATTDRDCSVNYVVGKDGSIGLCVEEKDRAWTSGGVLTVNGITGSENDHRAITIEVASDTTDPYAVTDAAYESLIKLVADICKRNGIPKLLWKADKSLVGQVDKQNMTVHRWFDYKACPGDYLYDRHGDIAEKVNAILGEGEQPSPVVPEGEYQVIAGTCTSREAAEELLARVKNAGCSDAYITPDDQPTYVTYTVKKGDTLYGIAQRFMGNGVDWKKIAEYNGMSGAIIHVGDKIKIPC